MKYLMNIFAWALIMAITVCGMHIAKADEMPSYMKDGVVIVTLKDGKTYKFSSNDFKVVKREDKRLTNHTLGIAPSEQEQKVIVKEVPVQHKNILSVEVVKSMADPSTDSDAGGTIVSTKSKVGVGAMYQRNVYKDLYLGGRVDSNRGAGVSVGVGF